MYLNEHYKNNKLITIIALFTFVQISYGQYCIPRRFDTIAFTANQIDSVMNEKFGENYNWQDTIIQNLKMDIYFPKTSIDTLAKRPLIVMIHPGGFYLGTRHRYREYCREFAKRGYVAATIDYRIGWDFGLGQHYDTLPMPVQISYPFNCQGDSTSSIKALYRALQDENAAIRYLVHYADTVTNIDTNYIFVGGGSAGGVSALGLQYTRQDFFDAHFGDLNLYDSLGPLDSSTNTLTETFSLAGIISMWGAVPDTSLITTANSLPTLMIHCTGDSLVPCISSNYFSCPNYVQSQGSCEISTRLKNLNQCYEFNYFDAPYPENGCHNVYSYSYHIDRISKFAKRVMCNDCRQIIIENQIEIANDTIPILSLPNDNINKNEINIYPNPVKDILFIGKNTDIEIKTLIVYDILGKVVLIKKNRFNKVDLSDLNSGILFIKIETERGTITKKIIKE